MNLLCVEMELLKTFLTVMVIGFRVDECMFDTNNQNCGYNLTCISPECKQTVFIQGYLIFYQHFVTSYQPVVKTERLSVFSR